MKLTTLASISLNLIIASSMVWAGTISVTDHLEPEYKIAQTQINKSVRDHRAQEIECLALNIYWETKAVSLADGMAVSDVVMNRVKDSRFPSSVCGVVKQANKDSNGNIIKHKCQFSWFCDGKADVPKNVEAWERSRKLARDIYIDKDYIGITEGATHYHAYYVKPSWRLQMDRTTRIGSHIFYRWK